MRTLPKAFSLFLGRRLGDALYYFDARHKAVTYANIKVALGDKLSCEQLSCLTRDFYQRLGQSFIEVFFIPQVDKKYLDKYIIFQGLDYIREGRKKGKGVLIAAMHIGSWELSNVICAYLDFPFNFFIRGQRYPRLDRLLNSYRIQKGCKIISREDSIRKVLVALKNNEAIGITVDQGGKTGIPIKFFGKSASMPTGAVKLALKYGAVIVPAFYVRIKGPYVKLIIDAPYQLKRTGDPEKDTLDNLQEIVHSFQRRILEHPAEYLWHYKVWKYSNERTILVLSDGKTGHLRQAEALAKILVGVLRERGITAKVVTEEVKFKNKFSRRALGVSCGLGGKYQCQGCLWCLRAFLEKENYKSLAALKPDIIISCGAAVAAVNNVLSRENVAKSVAILRPGILSVRRFDLVIMPRHDRPPKRRNVVVTEGALNLINEAYLREQSKKLILPPATRHSLPATYLGLLIGGNTKNFTLSKDTVLEVIKQIKLVSEKLNTDILVTTSRRTSLDVEDLIKKEFRDYPRCRLLIIANEKNIPEAVGGILGLSSVVITSAESISMISEAVSSKKYVLVFREAGLNRRHEKFLEYFTRNKYIYLAQAQDLGKKIAQLLQDKPQVKVLKDNFVVAEALKGIL